MARVFITGLTGQDGSYLAERLLADGVDVHGLVLDRPGEPTPAEGAVAHVGDLADPASYLPIVRDLAPDAIFNLAGISSVAQSWELPAQTMRLTGLAAIELLELARELDCRFVQASSAEIFGQPTESPQNESTPIRPTSPYGAAKTAAHQVVGQLRGQGLFACSAILYNHESPRRPENFVTRKITSGAARIARGEASRLTLGNLDARRDWGWAPDYVDAMVRMVHSDVPDDYVVATGSSHSVRDFAAAAFTAAGLGDWQEYVDTDAALIPPADPAEQRGDSTRARTVLGWSPSIDFETLVARMVEADLGGGA